MCQTSLRCLLAPLVSRLWAEMQVSLDRTIQNSRSQHPIRVRKVEKHTGYQKVSGIPHKTSMLNITASFWRGSAKIRCFKLCCVFNLLLKYTFSKLSKHKRFPLGIIFLFFFNLSSLLHLCNQAKLGLFLSSFLLTFGCCPPPQLRLCV